MKDEKFACRIDGCDCHHCTKCGHHYDPACGQNGICDECIIDQARDTSEAQAKAFDGNYEEANLYFGW